ncbi:DoxX family membrane protein [Streptomyces ziwulingensis]|uniref:DoxX family membrane protein n=1 Tax=Streptomyces ziwulingensis TaxID=1045501 RepID=A0ABP9AXS6_9ACTN
MPSDPAQVVVNHASFRVQLGASTGRTRSARISRHLSATQGTARVPAAGAPARRRAVVWSGRSDPDDTGAHRLLQAVRAGAEEAATDAGATQFIPRVDGPGSSGGTITTGGPGRDGYEGYDRYDGYGRYDRHGGHAGHDAHGGYDEYDGYGDALTGQTLETPVVGAQRTAGHDDAGTRLLPHLATVGSAYDEPGYTHDEYAAYPEYPEYPGDPTEDEDEDDDAATAVRSRDGRPSDDPARHAYYPGRRMNLGVVLLPLRVFLGFISIYAGMGKLCDPVYFDGGERGSMVKWLNTLHPWEVAEPLRQFALSHPVGSGLVIAFLQVIVGVLTVLGCWQRVTAGVGAFLSAALLLTVSWKSVPVYDAPDIIYLAAWSPLIIAGAPVYSVDGRLAGGAWRRLGPRADLWALRRYVLRRGALVTFLVAGVTLLVGSLLGGAVRDADRVVVPGPGEAPRNELPGAPLSPAPGERQRRTPEATSSPTQSATSGTAGPEDTASTAPDATRDTGTTTGGGAPTEPQGSTGGQAPPQQTTPAGQAPSTSAGPTGGGGGGGGGAATGGGGAPPGANTGTGSSTGGDGGATSPGEPGLVGGLLG